MSVSFLFPVNAHVFICLKIIIIKKPYLILVLQTVINSQNQNCSIVVLISLSQLLVCTLSGSFIQHPCPALFTSYFLYYSVNVLKSVWLGVGALSVKY